MLGAPIRIGTDQLPDPPIIACIIWISKYGFINNLIRLNREHRKQFGRSSNMDPFLFVIASTFPGLKLPGKNFELGGGGDPPGELIVPQTDTGE